MYLQVVNEIVKNVCGPVKYGIPKITS